MLNGGKSPSPIEIGKHCKMMSGLDGDSWIQEARSDHCAFTPSILHLIYE